MRWGGGPLGERFRCYLCGVHFKVGDYWRFQFVNKRSINFLVCEACDTPDLMEKWWAHWGHLQSWAWLLT